MELFAKTFSFSPMSPLWIGLALCGCRTVIRSILPSLGVLRDYPFFRPSVDAAAWTGVSQSFMDHHLPGISCNGLVPRADVWRIRHYFSNMYPTICFPTLLPTDGRHLDTCDLKMWSSRFEVTLLARTNGGIRIGVGHSARRSIPVSPPDPCEHIIWMKNASLPTKRTSRWQTINLCSRFLERPQNLSLSGVAIRLKKVLVEPLSLVDVNLTWSWRITKDTSPKTGFIQAWLRAVET